MSGGGEWSRRTERYMKTWSGQMKIREYEHIGGHTYYRRAHLIIGTIGATSSIGDLFSSLSGLFINNAAESCDAACAVGSVCMNLRIAAIVLTAVVATSIMLLVFYNPSETAEAHKTAASEYNKMWQSIDLVLVRRREDRDVFWKFTKPLLDEYERVVAAAPVIPTLTAGQDNQVVVLGIGSILAAPGEAEVEDEVVDDPIAEIERQNGERFEKIRAKHRARTLEEGLVAQLRLTNDTPMQWFKKRLGLRNDEEEE